MGVLGKSKAKGVNSERKSGVEPLRRLAGFLSDLPATPAAALVPNCIGLSFPLDPISKAERGNLTSGQPKFSIQRAQAVAQRTGEDTPA